MINNVGTDHLISAIAIEKYLQSSLVNGAYAKFMTLNRAACQSNWLEINYLNKTNQLLHIGRNLSITQPSQTSYSSARADK